jgi:hypothetical protein
MLLHHTQSVPMIDETSALRGNMPQCNDEEAASNHVSRSPLRRQYGPDGPHMDDRRPQYAAHYGANHGEGLCRLLPSVLRVTNNPALAPFANVPCRCTGYFMGGEGAWNHVNSCLHHASNWTCAHDHVLRALERICHVACFATNHKRVLTSEGNGHANLEIRNLSVTQQTDLLVDVTLLHNFICTCQIIVGQNQAQLRNPDNPDHILESVAADKIRNYRDRYNHAASAGVSTAV